jgi:hypothetical protein
MEGTYFLCRDVLLVPSNDILSIFSGLSVLACRVSASDGILQLLGQHYTNSTSIRPLVTMLYITKLYHHPLSALLRFTPTCLHSIVLLPWLQPILAAQRYASTLRVRFALFFTYSLLWGDYRIGA